MTRDHTQLMRCWKRSSYQPPMISTWCQTYNCHGWREGGLGHATANTALEHIEYPKLKRFEKQQGWKTSLTLSRSRSRDSQWDVPSPHPEKRGSLSPKTLGGIWMDRLSLVSSSLLPVASTLCPVTCPHSLLLFIKPSVTMVSLTPSRVFISLWRLCVLEKLY